MVDEKVQDSEGKKSAEAKRNRAPPPPVANPAKIKGKIGSEM